MGAVDRKRSRMAQAAAARPGGRVNATGIGGQDALRRMAQAVAAQVCREAPGPCTFGARRHLCPGGLGPAGARHRRRSGAVHAALPSAARLVGTTGHRLPLPEASGPRQRSRPYSCSTTCSAGSSDTPQPGEQPLGRRAARCLCPNSWRKRPPARAGRVREHAVERLSLRSLSSVDGRQVDHLPQQWPSTPWPLGGRAATAGPWGSLSPERSCGAASDPGRSARELAALAQSSARAGGPLRGAT